MYPKREAALRIALKHHKARAAERAAEHTPRHHAMLPGSEKLCRAFDLAEQSGDYTAVERLLAPAFAAGDRARERAEARLHGRRP